MENQISLKIYNTRSYILKNVVFTFPIFFMIMIGFFGLKSTFLGYFDEILACLYFVYIIFNILAFRNSTDLKFSFYFVFFILIGLGGNLINKDVVFDFKYTIIDIFMFIKPYIYMLAAVFYYKRNKYNTDFSYVSKISKILITIIFIGGIYHIFANHFDINYITKVNRYSLFTNFCGTLASYIIIFHACVLLSDSKNKLLWSIISLIDILITTSGVGILSLFLTIIFYYFYKKIGLKWYHLFVIALLAIFVGWNEISGYLLSKDAARSLMFQNAFKCMFSYFPFGAGFANYGGYGAAYNYSSLYYKFGYDSIWGLQPLSLGGPNFLFDTYYPMIIGQFGFVGFLIYTFIAIKIFVMLFRKKDYLTLSLFLMFIITGFGFNFSSAETCIQFFIIGLAYVTYDKKLTL